MRQFSYFFILLFLIFHSITFAQKKVLNAIRTDEKITIDGKIDESVWDTAPIATDFISYSPDNGTPAEKNKKTEVRIIYNNDAIYVAAKMYDNEPDKILKQITKRDASGIYDNFGIFINGFNDSQQDFRFYVSASGVQADCISNIDAIEDFSWNAVWDSEAKITDFGWVVEMKIPYAALRFPSNNEQTWGLNFYREVRRTRQSYTWNHIDNNISNENIQAGLLEGIENIVTPTRLFFNPYASYYLTNEETEELKGEFKAGLDIKYGVTDAFTLDVILVPDFGQTKFDNVILNLTPFEQEFNENRPFFTEGVDLFTKEKLVYTRRIGGAPSYYPELDENEVINDYPSNVNIINAIKFSGRTNGNLGIGVLNAVTQETTTEITNTETNETYTEVVEPVANYNVLVFDQRIRDNSSISFVNTSVIRDGKFRDANVSALLFNLNTKKNTYNVDGNFNYSYINEYGNEGVSQGFDTTLRFAKTSGNFRASIGGQYVSEDYDCNDLGINFITHYSSLSGNISYRILEPTNTFNKLESTLGYYSEFDNETGYIQKNELSLNTFAYNLKNDSFSFNILCRPTEIYNFYEPGSIDESTYFIEPKFIGATFNYSSNYNRKFAIDFIPRYRLYDQENREDYGVIISPSYRFNDHFTANIDFDFYRQNNNIGRIELDEYDSTNETIFARRNIVTYVNTINGKYAINNAMNIYLAVRHYWSYTTNLQYYNLLEDGTIENNDNYKVNNDINFNSWNFDLSYSWWFAPGSEMYILYRNNSLLQENNYNPNYFENTKDVVSWNDLNQIFSISIRYHIDYNSFKKK